MNNTSRQTLRTIGRKFLWLMLLFVVLDIIYRYTLYPHELRENCTLKALSDKAAIEQADIVYLGESSNRTYGLNDTDTNYISDMIARQLPDHKVANLSKDACHAGIYYDILRNIPADNHVRTAIVTVNMRSFSSEWIYSNLEPALQKEQCFMKKAPALYQRLLIAFKAYAHWTESERNKIVRDHIKKQKIKLPNYFPYHSAAEWDHAIGKQDRLFNGKAVSADTIQLVCHYIKCFAYEMDDNNPRVRDLDKIVRLCKQRGWKLVFHILPDNIEQMRQLVGPELPMLMQRNAQYIINRYTPQGVIVVNNQDAVCDRDFRDRDFPTEHYLQTGRQTVANAIVENLYPEKNNNK